ncbi:MAG: ribonuclease HII [Fimbriimonadaceae bacterium]|nr:ribonuclease HII [Fimbriimonadaceae bacterium]QYK56283.1 MAG: ribonuclease HII [Fimbriimonadaceae bacterium]
MPCLPFRPGVAGCDEAGRGPLAGPVVCAAVVLRRGFDAEGIDDSKRLDPDRRLELAERIRTGSACWAVEFIDVAEVDDLNILWASMTGMARALAKLQPCPKKAVVDGNIVPPGAPCECKAIVGGDGKNAAIAAASILAKTARDQYMAEMGGLYPEYGFERHFGYPTPEHLEALRAHGPCPIHRRSFTRIREMIEQPCLTFVD